MATVAYKTLYQGQPSTSVAAVYSPASVAAVIDHAVVCNPTAGAVTLTAHLIKSGGSPSDANMVIKTKSVAAGATEILSELINARLASGDEIELEASANTSLTVTIGGREISS